MAGGEAEVPGPEGGRLGQQDSLSILSAPVGLGSAPQPLPSQPLHENRGLSVLYHLGSPTPLRGQVSHTHSKEQLLILSWRRRPALLRKQSVNKERCVVFGM